MEHAYGVGLLQDFIDFFILRQLGQVYGLAVVSRYEFDAVLQDSHHAETKQVYLDDAEVDAPKTDAQSDRYDEYGSDPAKPVPFRTRPVLANDESAWRTWLLDDQRFVDGRPDVLTWETAPITTPIKLVGEPIVHLIASTSGTDSDWVVKLIDVYPNDQPARLDTEGLSLARWGCSRI